MSDVAEAPREIAHDAAGRVARRGVDESRARDRARAARRRDPKPLKLMVEIDAARGLPRDARRAHVAVRKIGDSRVAVVTRAADRDG